MRSLESILVPDGYGIIRANYGKQALARARATAPDVIILEERYSDLSGIDVCRSLRIDPQISSYTPIVITTPGRRTRQTRLEALAAGAWDYLGLPVDAEDLLLRLRSFVEAKLAVDRIREDSLLARGSWLYSRNGLLRRAVELYSDARRSGRSLACVAFGAAQGTPQAIERIANALRRAGRKADAIGLIGEDEFAILAPGTDVAGAQTLSERLVDLLESTSKNGGSEVRAAAGYCAMSDIASTEGLDPLEILERATTALEAARLNPGQGSVRGYEMGVTGRSA